MRLVEGTGVMVVSLEEWVLRKRFVDFDEADMDFLVGHRVQAEEYADEVVEEFYAALRRFDRTRQLLAGQTVLGALKRLQRQYLLELFGGDYGEAYLAKRLSVGRRHQEIQLSLEDYIGAFNLQLQLLTPRILRTAPERKAAYVLKALLKLVHLDMGLAVSAYLATYPSDAQNLDDSLVAPLEDQPEDGHGEAGSAPVIAT